MAFCIHCGKQVADGVAFCPACGKPLAAGGAAPPPPPAAAYQPPAAGYQPPAAYPPPAAQAPPSNQYVPGGGQQMGGSADAQQNKGMAIVAYIIFFIPLLTGAHKTSPFVKYHTNQGILLFGLGVIYGILSAILGAIFWVLGTILGFLSLGILALLIYGAYNAYNGQMKPLPLIGGITILK